MKYDPIDILIKQVDDHNQNVEFHPYTMFEAWDCNERPQWQIDLAKKDGVDLLATEHLKIYGATPHKFQSGIVYSEALLNLTIAGSQTGKSHAELIRDVATATGEFPYSMRYDKGVDTGIPRTVNADNIRRFGRIDAVTGSVLDGDVKKLADWIRGDREWNCGNIIGTGKMPERMIAPDGAKYWIGTTRRAYIEMWLPSLNIHAKENCIIPPHFIDVGRGNKGYSAINQKIGRAHV